MYKSAKYIYDKNEYGKPKNKQYNSWHNSLNVFNGFVNPFASQLVLYLFIVFVFLLIVDYFLTIFSINQHTQEFNPMVVFIFNNFNYPEIILLFFKVVVITLNGFLLFLLKKWKNKSTGKLSTFYIILASAFAFGVVIYDIAVIKRLDVSSVNRISMWFFETLGLV